MADGTPLDRSRTSAWQPQVRVDRSSTLPSHMSTDVGNPRSISCHRRGGKLRGILALCREESSTAPGENAGMENQFLSVTLDVYLSNYKYSQDFQYIHSACQVIPSTSNAPRERLQLVMLSKSPKALLTSPLFFVVALFSFSAYMHVSSFFLPIPLWSGRLQILAVPVLRVSVCIHLLNVKCKPSI